MRTHTSTIELCKDHAYKLQHKLYTEGNAGHIDEQATAQGDCAMFGHAPAEFVMHILEDVPTPELTPEQEQMKARIEQILECAGCEDPENAPHAHDCEREEG